MSKRKLITLLAVLTLAAPLMFYGCSGGDDGSTGATGATGATGPPGPPGVGVLAPTQIESCAICHNDQTIRDGNAHQADYDQRFQDQIVTVVVYGISLTRIMRQTIPTYVTFTMTKKRRTLSLYG